jgi:hypothetical protein
MKPSRDINRAKAGTPMNPITATGETLVRFVRPESRSQFVSEWTEVLKSRRMAVDPAAAIRVIVEPLLRRECRTEFSSLLRKIKAAQKSEHAAPTQ